MARGRVACCREPVRLILMRAHTNHQEEMAFLLDLERYVGVSLTEDKVLKAEGREETKAQEEGDVFKK